MEHNLSFYYFTLDGRFQGDKCPEIDDDVETTQYHLGLRRGLDESTFVPGRLFLPANTEFQFR